MNTYYDEQEDIDEMSGYRRAQRQARKNHEQLNHTAGIPWWWIAILIGMMAWAMSGCTKTTRVTEDELMSVWTNGYLHGCEGYRNYKRDSIEFRQKMKIGL